MKMKSESQFSVEVPQEEPRSGSKLLANPKATFSKTNINGDNSPIKAPQASLERKPTLLVRSPSLEEDSIFNENERSVPVE